MSEQEAFLTLLARVRTGDEAAANELVVRYEPAIRRYVRARLTDERLRRTIDTVDICQSVLGGFFFRVALGQFELESPNQLIKLLATMASNKLTDLARRHQTEKRGHGQHADQPSDELPLEGRTPTPSRIVSGQEILSRFRSRLSEEECYLFEQRIRGRPWKDLADDLGTNADALRMRWNRVLERVSTELGLDKSFYE